MRLPSLNSAEADPAAFDFLDEALLGRRMVYLGESDHFVAERMEFRLLLIRELVKRGYRRIGMEMGFSDARRMDRYLETGDEEWLNRVALYGYKEDMRTDREDQVPGWTDDSHPEFRRAVTDEARWFLRQLRRMNEELPAGEPRIEWFGYDLSFRPGGAYADAAELLKPHGNSALVQEVLAGAVREAGESRIEEAERLEALVAFLDERRAELVTLVGERGAVSLRRSYQRMADAFRFIDGLQGEYDAAAVAAALGRRE
ncbi:MAG: erythromycin esterase family protein, partial [bacterium]|nr:erythromycin esterase family protein [bacterium]